MCRRSQRRGGPMELRPESLPSPLHFLVPAQHDYVSELGWGILLAFIHRPSLQRGVESPSPWHLLCAVPIKGWHPVDHYWQPCMRWDEAREESGPFIVYLFHSRWRSWWGGLLTCILDSSPSVTCSGTLKQSMKLTQPFSFPYNEGVFFLSLTIIFTLPLQSQSLLPQLLTSGGVQNRASFFFPWHFSLF